MPGQPADPSAGLAAAHDPAEWAALLGEAEAEAQMSDRLRDLDDPQGAARHARRATELLRQTQDTAGLARALLREAEIAAVIEDYDRVSALTAEVRQRLAGVPCGDLAQAVNLQAMIHYMHGQYREAGAETLQEAEIREALGDHEGLAKCLNNLGLIHMELGDLSKALGHLTRCFEYIAACPAPLESLASSCQINIGNVHQIMRDFDQATDAFRQGVEAAQRAGHAGNEIAGLTGIGLVAIDRQAYREALRSLSQALALAQAHGRRYDEAEILDALGQGYAGLGQHDLARDTYGQALGIAEELGAVPTQQNIRFHLARLYAGAGQPQEAAEQYRAALERAEGSGSERAALEIHEELGGVLQTLGQFEAAAFHLRAALSLERALKDRSSQEAIQTLTAHLEIERAKHQAETYRLMNETSQQARTEAEALVRARTAELELAQRDIITRLGIAGEYRDDKTGEHTQRVSNLAAALAGAIGLPEDEVELIRLAARLHDIGKIGVPDSVLLKTGRLTAEEFTVMKHHAIIGARVLGGGQSALMRRAEEIALTHHERWDGQGYPQGLSGEDIPLSGRIVAIVDVWDALTTERSYKPAWSREEAWQELTGQAGRQFDPTLVEVFLGMLAGVGAAGVAAPDGLPPAPEPQAPPGLDSVRLLPAHVVQHISALNEEAWCRRQSDPAPSRQLAQEVHLISDQHGYERGQGQALRTLAFHDLSAGAFRAAIDRLDQALGIARAGGDLPLERDVQALLGGVYRRIHSTQRALGCLLRSAELSRTLADHAGEAEALMAVGDLSASRIKDPEQALGFYGQADQVLEQGGLAAGRAACLYRLADVCLALGRLDQAMVHGRRAVDASREADDAVHLTLSLSVMARALDARGEHAQAGALHREALERMPVPDSTPDGALSRVGLYHADHLEAGGALDEAREHYERVLADCARLDLFRLIPQVHHRLTRLHHTQGDMEAAMRHLEAERAAQQEMFEQETALETRALMEQYEIERAESEAELYRLRSVELASANAALEQANREKSALVAALQEQATRLERQLREDSLSGVYNRRHIEQLLAREFEEHRATGRPLSLVLLDIDGFRQVNDAFSHPVGDEVLRRLGALLHTSCRAQDAPGRYGGEEFVLVLPDTSLQDAARVAERIRGRVEHMPWQEVAPGLQITLSLGVASSEGLDHFERLIARAEHQLAEARRQREHPAC